MKVLKVNTRGVLKRGVNKCWIGKVQQQQQSRNHRTYLPLRNAILADIVLLILVENFQFWGGGGRIDSESKRRS